MKKVFTFFFGAILLSLLIYSNVFSSDVTTLMKIFDDFNSYSNGDLTNQGSWLYSNTDKFVVEDNVAKEGGKAISITSTSTDPLWIVSVFGHFMSSGTKGAYFRSTNISAGVSAMGIISDNPPYLPIGAAWTNRGIIGLVAENRNLILGTYNTNEWNWIEIEWRSTPSQQIRGRVNNGDWSDWINPKSGWTTGAVALVLTTVFSNGETNYFDFISDSPYVESVSPSSLSENAVSNLPDDSTTFTLSDDTATSTDDTATSTSD